MIKFIALGNLHITVEKDGKAIAQGVRSRVLLRLRAIGELEFYGSLTECDYQYFLKHFLKYGFQITSSTTAPATAIGKTIYNLNLTKHGNHNSQ